MTVTKLFQYKTYTHAELATMFIHIYNCYEKLSETKYRTKKVKIAVHFAKDKENVFPKYIFYQHRAGYNSAIFLSNFKEYYDKHYFNRPTNIEDYHIVLFVSYSTYSH